MKALRFVTAASLFDGHDVSINIMRRILQAKGAEVIHLGHNRSALEVVDTALCEDADAIALSSYQGGHMEYFSYVRELLDQRGAQHIALFGGGGGVITPKEIKELESKGIDKIYSPHDGMELGLEGMIELLIRFSRYYPKKKFALISVDPTKKRTQGALLGDRIRLGDTTSEQLYVRSLATRGSGTELSPQIEKVCTYLKSRDFDLIIVETSGIGQASDAITKVSDKTLYVMTPEYGAATQLEKIEMLEVANFIALNKFEKPRAEDALRDIRKQYRRNHGLFHSPEDGELPIFATMASRFNDPGVNALFIELAHSFDLGVSDSMKSLKSIRGERERETIIPPNRVGYLRSISESVRNYNQKTIDLQNPVR